MTERRQVSRELGGADPLDIEIGIPGSSILERIGLGSLAPLLRARAALGLRPALAPAIVLLPAGFVLGPEVLNAISFETLGYLDTVVTIALAVLGVFVGIAFGPHLRSARGLIVASSIEALTTIGLVAAALAFLLRGGSLPPGASALLVALCLGISASASSAGSGEDANPARRTASRIADLDDVLPILLGGVLLLFAPGARPEAGLWAIAAAPAIGLVIGVAGWLLFERAESDAERGALLLGALALLGGAPAYVGGSPLAAGFVAGLLWTLAPGRSDWIVAGDLRKVQHPVVVLLLLTAGARCEPSLAAAWLVGPYVLFRIAGKLTGGWIVTRMRGLGAHGIPRDLGLHLIPPGVIGVAFAIGFMQILPAPIGTLVVTTVALGSVLSEMAALYVTPVQDSGN